MESAIWLAKIFGPLLIIFGVWSFIFVKEVQKSMTSYKTNPALVHLNGFFNLVLGLIILSLHFSWTPNMAVLLTILGWVLVIRAVILLFASTLVESAGMKHDAIARLVGLICLIWGIAIFSIAL